MKIIAISILILISLLTYSQTDTIVIYINGKGQETSQVDAKYVRKIFEENSKIRVNDYYLTGELQMKGAFNSIKCSTKNGNYEYYFKDGNISTKGKYINGKQVGRWKYKDDEGYKKFDIENFDKKGGQDGKSIYRYRNGSIKSVINYADDMKHGKCKWYYKNGQKSTVAIYKNGALISYTYFDENGDKIKNVSE